MSGFAVLVVDDEAAIREALAQTLALADIPAITAATVDAALAQLAEDRRGAGAIGGVLCDVKMPGRNGFDFLAASVAADPDLPVVILTGHGDVPMAVRAMRDGAYDFIEKPAPGRRLLDVLGRALEKRRLVIENRAFRARLEGDAGVGRRIIGSTPAIERFRETLRRVAASDADTLILGETGVGKELAARALHDQSARRDGRFVAVNCGALPQEIAESELFGHEAGAFTGAAKRRVGKFVFADGGTVFLDEIESMPLALQVSLLRVLQEREVTPLGSNTSVPVDIRVVAATKTDLRALSETGAFREDLYYRLEVARLDVPPLRDRLEDAPLLFAAFVQMAADRRGGAAPDIPDALRAWLLEQTWPGNVRQLRNAAERFVIGLPIGPDAAAPDRDETADLPTRMDAYERRLILEALRAAHGRVAQACEQLGVPRNTLYDKLKKYRILREEYG